MLYIVVKKVRVVLSQLLMVGGDSDLISVLAIN